MPHEKASHNRGPAAASANREALIGAARRLFAERGYEVPLSAIAKAAGVGQGVLYRHFPSRIALALAVFSENIDDLARLAALHPGPDALGILMAQLLGSVVESSAFVDAVVHAGEVPEFEGTGTIAALLEGPLARAQESGLVRSDLEVADLILVVRMAYGVVVTNPSPDAAPAAVLRAVGLVDASIMESVRATWN
ncbi:TetR/AcrR family transcriptional regulator [Nigerium massiliense]|uniref:TetR/AcrR family transcriptional regulator n=1 Tax=Nigerium massiliense TaxID=1522317 RepID=UPI00058AEA58|nr:helix-turn-helix domain-containing protein [Nigerium massiliense]